MPKRLLPTLLLLGCSKTEAPPTKEPPGKPDIQVSPTSIAFGELPVGERVQETVTVTNLGDGPLTLQPLDLEGNSDGFVLSEPDTMSLLPDQSTEFTVTFAPLGGSANADRILVQSDDPDEEWSLVDLQGVGLAGELRIRAEGWDFGMIYVGCAEPKQVHIHNEGNRPLVVSAIDYTSGGPEFWLDIQEFLNGPLPWTLGAGDQHIVYLWYEPVDAGADEGTLEVESTDPQLPTWPTITTGDGVIYDDQIDNYLCTVDSNLNIFPLSRSPVQASIHVSVNGVERTEGWTYGAGDNAIAFFAGSTPVVGDTVEISYWVWGNCNR